MAKTINLSKIKFKIDLENEKGEEPILEKDAKTFATKAQVLELIDDTLSKIANAEETEY
jgi:hypothetical protein